MNQRTKENSKPRSEPFGLQTPNAWATRLRQPKKHKPTIAGELAEKCKESKEIPFIFYRLFSFFSLTQQRTTNTEK
jgi:hypothetical protein